MWNFSPGPCITTCLLCIFPQDHWLLPSLSRILLSFCFHCCQPIHQLWRSVSYLRHAVFWARAMIMLQQNPSIEDMTVLNATRGKFGLPKERDRELEVGQPAWGVKSKSSRHSVIVFFRVIILFNHSFIERKRFQGCSPKSTLLLFFVQTHYN